MRAFVLAAASLFRYIQITGISTELVFVPICFFRIPYNLLLFFSIIAVRKRTCPFANLFTNPLKTSNYEKETATVNCPAQMLCGRSVRVIKGTYEKEQVVDVRDRAGHPYPVAQEETVSRASVRLIWKSADNVAFINPFCCL